MSQPRKGINNDSVFVMQKEHWHAVQFDWDLTGDAAFERLMQKNSASSDPIVSSRSSHEVC